jgi:hypothetical protein
MSFLLLHIVVALAERNNDMQIKGNVPLRMTAG